MRHILEHVVAAVRASGYRPTVLGPQRRDPITLDEAAGVRLALTLLATAPLNRGDRIRAVAAGIAAMSIEETYYWYCALRWPAIVRGAPCHPGTVVRRIGQDGSHDRPTTLAHRGLAARPRTRHRVSPRTGSRHDAAALIGLHVWWARRPSSPPRAWYLRGCCQPGHRSWPRYCQTPSHFSRSTRTTHGCSAWSVSGVIQSPRGRHTTRPWQMACAFRIPIVTAGVPEFAWIADVELLHAVLRHTWGGELPLVADPTAGGGSIPFTAARLGIPTLCQRPERRCRCSIAGWRRDSGADTAWI